MIDPPLEDHAFGVEMQITELVERRQRAVVQGRTERARHLQREIDALQDELVRASEHLADEAWGQPRIDTHEG